MRDRQLIINFEYICTIMASYNPNAPPGITNLPWRVHALLYAAYSWNSIVTLIETSKTCQSMITYYKHQDPNWTNRAHRAMHRCNHIRAYKNSPYDSRATVVIRDSSEAEENTRDYSNVTHLCVPYFNGTQIPAAVRVLPQLQHLVTDYDFTLAQKNLIPRTIQTLYIGDYHGMDLREFPCLYNARIMHMDMAHIPELVAVRDLYIWGRNSNVRLLPEYHYVLDKLMRLRLDHIIVDREIPVNVTDLCLELRFSYWNDGEEHPWALPNTGRLRNCVIRFEHKGSGLVFMAMDMCARVEKLRVIMRMNRYPPREEIISKLHELQALCGARGEEFACRELYIGTENDAGESVFVGDTRVTFENLYGVHPAYHRFESNGHVYWEVPVLT